MQLDLPCWRAAPPAPPASRRSRRRGPSASRVPVPSGRSGSVCVADTLDCASITCRQCGHSTKAAQAMAGQRVRRQPQMQSAGLSVDRGRETELRGATGSHSRRRCRHLVRGSHRTSVGDSSARGGPCYLSPRRRPRTRRGDGVTRDDGGASIRRRHGRRGLRPGARGLLARPATLERPRPATAAGG